MAYSQYADGGEAAGDHRKEYIADETPRAVVMIEIEEVHDYTSEEEDEQEPDMFQNSERATMSRKNSATKLRKARTLLNKSSKAIDKPKKENTERLRRKSEKILDGNIQNHTSSKVSV